MEEICFNFWRLLRPNISVNEMILLENIHNKTFKGRQGRKNYISEKTQRKLEAIKNLCKEKFTLGKMTVVALALYFPKSLPKQKQLG